jgi:hypothetical protein
MSAILVRHLVVELGELGFCSAEPTREDDGGWASESGGGAAIRSVESLKTIVRVGTVVWE